MCNNNIFPLGYLNFKVVDEPSTVLQIVLSQAQPLKRRRWMTQQVNIVEETIAKRSNGFKRWSKLELEVLQQKLGESPDLKNLIYAISKRVCKHKSS